ncbi:hypothetical protein [Chitinimonas sp. BJYL2]|uniref:hypothetical protein n=1 Tax=Chitinimonas sp. BJYL2 TaxID=2976696 RepID=UPI0022B35998|nr:hypothetical protein [Chitinimonas sp. BJYL2]
MSITLVIPDLYLPAQPGFSWLDGMDIATLAAALGRATVSTLPGATAVWPLQALGLAGAGMAQAGLAMDMPDAQDGHWLRADPVHLRADRDRALLFDATLLAISQSEADALVTSLNQLYAEDGMRFHAPTPSRWYVQLPQPADCLTTPLHAVVGQNIHQHLPTGPRALQWHKLLNEMQMLLYTHPVNDLREQSGRPTVNSIWLWGEGPVVRVGAPTCHTLHARAFDIRALAHAAGVVICDLPDSLDQAAPDSIVWLDNLSEFARRGDVTGWQAALADLQTRWLGPAMQSEGLNLILPGHRQGLSVRISRADRWKIWRRPVNLRKLLAEPVAD